MTKISIIIPILNEANYIGKLIQHVIDSSSSKNIAEIIVVDGGSTDGSPNIVQSFCFNEKDTETSSELPRQFIKFMASVKGRAKQMNTGAKLATGNILYFLHADSFPPKHFDQFIIDEINKGNDAGCFRMKFDSNHWWLKLAGWLTQLSWRASRGGDQSQFITKHLFSEIGGYDENYVIYEDYDLINKLYKRKQFTIIKKWLTTSSRRYKKHGVWKLQYHFWTIYVKKWLGDSPEELHRYYKNKIA